MSRKDVEDLIERELTAVPAMHGWCTVEKAKRMAALTYGASLCVELGVFGGRSLIATALALRDQGFGRVDGIDPYTKEAVVDGTNDRANDEWWQSLDLEAIARAAQGALDRLALNGYAQIIRTTSHMAAAMYTDKAIDVLHQDSNHSEEVSCAEVELWTPKIKPGGLWIFDDAHWPSTQRAQRMLLELGFEERENYGGQWKIYRRAAS